ncbi:MAG: hypothetical protein AAGA25_04985 [Planctomycetota bacterium]
MSTYDRRKTSLNLAIALCLITTALGISCLVGYSLTRHDNFATAGLAVFSFLLPAAGLITFGLIGFSVYLGSKAEPDDKSQTIRSTIAVFALVFMFFAAVICFGIGSKIATRYDLTISNQSGSVVNNVTISGGGVDERIEQIKAGAIHEVSLHFYLDEELTIEFESNDSVPQRHVVEEYVHSLFGGVTEVSIQSDLSVEIKR